MINEAEDEFQVLTFGENADNPGCPVLYKLYTLYMIMIIMYHVIMW